MRLFAPALRRAVVSVVAAVSALALSQQALADGTAQALPFSQNWSDTNTQLTTSKTDAGYNAAIWANVPGFEGFSGAGQSSAAPTAGNSTPNTRLAANSVATTNSGGVHEIADDAIGLLASSNGTGGGPALVLHLNTSGSSSVRLSYDARVLGKNGAAASQLLQLQWRVPVGTLPDTSTAWQNLGSAVTIPADATTSTTIPVVIEGSEIANQALVQLRWFLVRPASGSSHLVGVDNISAASGGGAPANTSFSINDVTMAEGNSGNTNFTFSVSKNGPDIAASVSFATADGSTNPASAGSDYTANSGTLSFAVGETSKPITVVVSGDADEEANETFTVTLSNATNSATISDTTGLGTISNDDQAGTACGQAATLISAVQGSGSATTLTGTVQIEGIVTGDFQGSASLKGFFVQEEDAQADGNGATSEGIFVFEDAATPAAVSVGQRVRVMGMPMEEFGQTVIGGPTTTVCASDQPLPAIIGINLPFAAADSAERLEGMRVRLPQNLYVTSNFQLGRFGEITLSSGERLVNPTQNNAPGGAGSARANAQAANNLNKILIDDGNNVQNRDPITYPNTGLTAENTLRGGDRVQNLEGIMSFGFNKYRIQPTANPLFVAENQRQNAPQLPGATGSFRAASFNVLNYFNGDGAGGGFPTARGADTQEEFTRQRDKIIAAMTAMRADVLGLIEIENDDFGNNSAIADLVRGLNAAAPSGTTYAYVTPAAADLSSGKLGGDQIKVSFIYRTQTVELIGAAKVLDNRFDPNFTEICNRPALAQTFKQLSSSLKFTAVVNHFKSKGSACSFGTTSTADDDPETGDGQGNGHEARRRAATVLRDWLATDPTASGSSNFLILGDLNAYAKEDPVTILEAAGFVNVAQRDHGNSPLLSYPFDDQWGTLDYALASSSLASQVSKAVDWTINGAEPSALDYNTQIPGPNNTVIITKTAGQKDSLYNPDPFRSSDHDPVVVEMTAAACVAGELGFKSAPYTIGEAAGSLTVTVQRTGGACGAASVTYATGSSGSGVQATAGEDYTAISGTLDWADNDMADKTFTVAIANDALDEADQEVFGLGLANATGAALAGGGSTAATTAGISDNDALPTVAFAAATSRFAEDVATGVVSVTVSLNTASGRDVTVPFSVGGTATAGAGSDYTQDTTSPLTIPAGQTSRTVQFTISDDTVQEPDETIELTIEPGVGNADTGSPATHTLTITDNDAPVQDTTPDAFSFLTRDNVGTGSLVTSETVTITGFTGTLTVTVSNGGQCSVAQGAFAASCPITPGQTLSVRHTAADAASTTKESVVTIGSGTATFRSITSANDRVPDAFGFTTQNNVAPGTPIVSNAITLTGFNAAAVITATSGFEYRINNGNWMSARGSLLPSDTLQLRHTSNSSSLGYTTSTIRVGGVEGSFRTRTRKAQ